MDVPMRLQVLHEFKEPSEADIIAEMQLLRFHEELRVEFQPIFDIDTRVVVACEALARWSSPVLGEVSPNVFFPLAEKMGILSQLSARLLREALFHAREWPEHVRLSFNLSALDLGSRENLNQILAILAPSNFPLDRIDFEITETEAEGSLEMLVRSVDILRMLGCGVSLDDFGTGHSNLGRLYALNVNKIKVDKMFLHDSGRSNIRRNLLEGILALARRLDIDTILEGVETEADLAFARDIGFHLAQGFLFSRPLSPSVTVAYLQWPVVRGN